MTYSESATFATELVEVGVLAANNDLMQPDLTIVAELYGEVGVLRVVEEADQVSNTLVCMGYHLLSVRHGRSAQ